MGRSIHHPVGLIHNSPSAYSGYTLLTNVMGGSHATLLDMEGRIVHRWNSEEGIVYAYLLPSGNLLCRTKPSTDVELVQNLGGSSAALLEINWDSEVIWRYDDPMLHHDFVRLSNGNTLALLFAPLDEKTTKKIQGGYVSEEDPATILGDLIREISPDGDTVSEWNISEILSYEEDVICPLEHRREWTHANCINLTPDGDFLVSFRNTSTIGIIGKESGQFLWKWGPGEVWHQHHPTFLDNGNILLFDNGSHSKGADRSRVIEVDPKNGEVKWEYTETPPMAFYSFHISSAERLANGNTLICEGAFGRIFEVTEKGDVVWEYVNPFQTPDLRTGAPSNMVFRAHKYGPHDPAILGRDLNPEKYANLNKMYSGVRPSGSGLIVA